VGNSRRLLFGCQLTESFLPLPCITLFKDFPCLCLFGEQKRTPFFLMVENTVRWGMMQPDGMGVKLFLSKSDEDLILF